MPRDDKSVLVFKPSSLGDIVHTLPAVARLKAARPGWRISWVVNTEWAPLLVGNPDVDEIIPFPRRDFSGPASWPRLAQWVRERIVGRRPELAIDFQGLLRTALMARLSEAGEIIGPLDAREGAGWLYGRTVPMPAGVPHAVERYLALADAVLGAAGSGPLQFPLPPGTPPAEAERVHRFVLVHPFSRGVGKSLRADQVEALCRQLAPWQAVIVGRSDEPVLAPSANVVDYLNCTSLPELIWLIRRAHFVISVDSGPMHLAAALGRPLVSIHTWTDPRKVGPYRPDAWVWKGGRIFRMSELNAISSDILAGAGQSIQVDDLNAIAALVKAVIAE